MPTFFSGHQLSLSVGSPWCARLWCKSQVHFLPSTRLARFSSCFNRGCFSCRKKNYKDLEIQSQAGKKSSAFFASRSLSCACAAPQLPRTAALPLLAGWPQEEPGGICDFLFQLNSSSNLQEGLGCLLLPHSVGRVGGAGGMSGLPADHGDIPKCRGGWCTSHLIKNSHPKACPLTTPLKGEAEGGEQPCSSPLAPPPLLARSSSSTGR